MKKYLLMLIALVSIFASTNLNACPNGSGWADKGVAIMELDGDCRMEVEFCSRYYMGDYEIWMSDVTFVGDCDNYTQDFDDNPKKYFDRMWENIVLKYDPFGTGAPIFPMCPDQSDATFKYGTPSCYSQDWQWEWVNDPNHPKGGYWRKTKAACNELYEAACIAELTGCVKLNELGEWVLETNIVHYSDGANCGQGCEFMCK
jgi:hypothetical protein